MKRILTILALAGILASLPQVAQATPGTEPEAEIVIDRDDMGGIAAGFIQQYGTGTEASLWFNVRLRPEPLIQDNAEAEEWSIELYPSTDCTGTMLAEAFGSDTPVYGPRVYGRVLNASLDGAGSTLLVHDGPTFFGHADMPGRHEIACVAP